MSEELFAPILETFDGLEILAKSKSKTIDKWKKMQQVAQHLEGKTSTDITFTSSHPSYDGAPVKHTLGSTIGNQHFLLGYVNPGFHVAPYHWVLVDPFLSPEEAATKEHPANPQFWERSGLESVDEGDTEEGSPHPEYGTRKAEKQAQEDLTAEAVQAYGGYSSFVGFPSLGIFFDAEKQTPYKWSMFRDSLFAVNNPEFAEAMNAGDAEVAPEQEPKALPEAVLDRADQEQGEFQKSVYPLVHSCFPRPGSIVGLCKGVGGELYGVVGRDRVYFYDTYGKETSLEIYGDLYKSFDLTDNGTLHPSILLNFAVNYLNIEKSLLEPFVEDTAPQEIIEDRLEKSARKTGFNWRKLFGG